MIRVAVTGAAGRMGRTLVRMIAEAPELELTGALEQADSLVLGQDAGQLAGAGTLGVAFSANVQAVCDRCDVLVDFSVPAATLAVLPACETARCGLVLGTTGFDTEGEAALVRAAQNIPLLKAPNMSVGVNLLFRLVEMAAKALGDSVDVEVLEAHHRHKIDAPSGTAMRLGEVLAQTLERDLKEQAEYGRRTGVRGRETIGFATVRAGDIVGDHTVLFAGDGERLELTHRAHSRENFAAGALRAARFLKGQPAGLYSMEDVLGF